MRGLKTPKRLLKVFYFAVPPNSNHFVKILSVGNVSGLYTNLIELFVVQIFVFIHIYKIFHSCAHFMNCLPISGSFCDLSMSSRSVGERRGEPRAARHAITGPYNKHHLISY